MTAQEPASPALHASKTSVQLSELKGSMASGIKNVQLKFLQSQQELSKMSTVEKHEAISRIYREGTQH